MSQSIRYAKSDAIQPRHGRGARRRAVVALAALTLTVGLAACGKSDPPETATSNETKPLSVGKESVFTVAMTQVASGPVISGSLEPERQATVRAEVSGPVLSTAVEEGQSVRAGAVLGRIDDVALAEAVQSARSAVRSAEQQVEVAKRNAERSESLVKGGAIPEREVETARWNVTAAEAALADARSRLTSVEEQRQKTVVHAPFAGIVSERSVAVGDTVQPGSPLFTIVDPTRMHLLARLPAERLSEVQVGTPVDFTVAGYPGQAFHGEVQRINPVADPTTRQVEIHVSLPNDSGRLVAGLYAQGRVSTTAKQALAIPAAAIDRSLGDAAVMRLAGGKVERVPVTLGITDDEQEQVEVVSGLAAGDQLLIGAARAITPGSQVSIEAAVAADKGAPTAAPGG